MGIVSTERTPRTARYIESGQWPDATLTADAPRHVERVQATCRRLRDRIAESGESARSVAKRADVAPSTITRILQGQTWCDVATLAALEDTLGADVWVPRDVDDSGHGSSQN